MRASHGNNSYNASQALRVAGRTTHPHPTPPGYGRAAHGCCGPTYKIHLTLTLLQDGAREKTFSLNYSSFAPKKRGCGSKGGTKNAPLIFVAQTPTTWIFSRHQVVIGEIQWAITSCFLILVKSPADEERCSLWLPHFYLYIFIPLVSI